MTTLRRSDIAAKRQQHNHERTTMSTTPEVKPGQVWADNDWRSRGRTLRVLSIDGEHAVCEVLTLSIQQQRMVDQGSAWANDVRGKTRRIALRRMKPTHTGYRLVEDVQP